jgi:NitT/TauT family transport system substrate-binding protein
MRSIKIFFIILLIISLILLSVSCNKKMLPNKLIIGSYFGEGDSLLFIAENIGLFKKNGVTVEIKKYETGVMAIEDVLTDKIDISCCSEAAFVVKSFDNQNLRIIVVYTILESQKIFTPADTGIKTPAGLKGKKIGITKESSAEFALAAYLSLNNINLNEVKIIYLTPNEYLNAIKERKIDAIVTWEPHIYNIKKELNNNIVDLSVNKIPQIFMLLNAKNEIIQQKKLEMDALLKSLKEAEDYLDKNISRSKIIIKEKMNVSEDYINYAWNNMFISLNLSQDVIFAMESEAKWRINNNMTKSKTLPNYVKYIYFGALEKIKPDSITIIR